MEKSKEQELSDLYQFHRTGWIQAKFSGHIEAAEIHYAEMMKALKELSNTTK